MSQPFTRDWKTPVAAVFLIFTAVACTPGTHRIPNNDDELVGRIKSHQIESHQANPVQLSEEQVRRGSLWYQLALHKDHMNVRLRLLNPAPRTTFFLPGPWAGHNDFAQDISLAGARGPDGPLPITIERELGRIDIETFNAPWVEIQYSVQLHNQPDAQTRYRGRLREEVLLAYAPTFLILPSDGISQTLRDIAIELRVPKDWQVVTTWPRVHVAPSELTPDTIIHGFVVDDIRSLRDAFIAAGPTLDTQHLQVESRNMTIAFEPGFDSTREEYVSAIHKIVTFYMERYGSRSDVTVFVTTTPEATSEALRGMGRRGGFVLELPPSAKHPHEAKAQDKLDEQTLILIAHEAFHMWNGHELVAHPAHELQTRWFKEGLTHYIALQSLRELGLLEERTILVELAKSAALYEQSIINRSTNNASAFDIARFPYDHGMMLALTIDAALHDLTDQQYTLNEWIITLLQDTRASNFHQYTEAQLKHALLTSYAPAAQRLNTIWIQNLEQQQPLAVAKLFKSIGLYWINNDTQLAPRLLPLEGKPPTYLKIFNGP